MGWLEEKFDRADLKRWRRDVLWAFFFPSEVLSDIVDSRAPQREKSNRKLSLLYTTRGFLLCTK